MHDSRTRVELVEVALLLLVAEEPATSDTRTRASRKGKGIEVTVVERTWRAIAPGS